MSVAAVLLAAASMTGFFSVHHHAGYDHPEATLQALIDAQARQRDNHVCVVGYVRGHGGDSAWVYWPEGHAIILWEPRSDDAPLTWSRRYLRLDEDIVPTEDDLHGSTYRETRAWVDRTIADCRAHGESFVLQRRASRH